MKNLSLILICLLSNYVFSQSEIKPKYPELFKSIPSYTLDLKQWQIELYSSSPNLYRITKSYDDYHANNKFVKNIHTQNYKYFLKNLESPVFTVDKDGIIIKLDKSPHKKGLINNKIQNLSDSYNEWNLLGPKLVQNNTDNENGHIRSPYQSNIYSIYKSKTTDNFLAISENSGIFVSTDAGQIWTNVTPKWKNNKHRKYPHEPLVYIDDFDLKFYISFQGNIWRSNDLGSSWEIISLNEDRITQMIVKNGVIYYSSKSGLYKYDTQKELIEAGFIWDFKIANDLNDFYIIKYNETLNISEFHTSTDRGKNFVLKNNGWWSPKKGRASTNNDNIRGGKIAMTEDSNIIYVALLGEEDDEIDDLGFAGLFKSTNKGESWINTSPSKEIGGPYSENNPCLVSSSFNGGYFQGWYDFDIEMINNNPNHLLVGGIRLRETTDGGLTWKDLKISEFEGSNTIYNLQHVDIQDIHYSNGKVFVSSDGGLNEYTLKNNELINPQILTNGLSDSDFWGLGIGQNKFSLVGGRYHNGDAIFLESFPDKTFKKYSGVEEGTGYVNKGLHFKMATSFGGVYEVPLDISNNNIKRLGKLNYPPNEGYVFFKRTDFETHKFYFDEIFYGSKNKLIKSLDFGLTSIVIHEFDSSEALITDIKIIGKDNKHIFLNLQEGYTSPSLMRSKDYGQTFEKLDLPFINESYYKSYWYNIQVEDEVIFISSPSLQSIYYSEDLGDSWSVFTDLPEDIEIYNFRKLKDSDKIIFLAQDYEESSTNDLFIINKEGHIEHLTSSLHNYLRIRDFEIFYPESKLVISGAGGVWESKIQTNSSKEISPLISKREFSQGEEITLSTHLNFPSESVFKYQWKIGGLEIESNEYFKRINSDDFEPGTYDLSLTAFLKSGDIVESEKHLNAFKIKPRPVLLNDVKSIHLVGSPSVLSLANCENIPLVSDTNNRHLVALDLKTNTLVLPHDAFLDETNFDISDNEKLVNNFIDNTSAKILFYYSKSSHYMSNYEALLKRRGVETKVVFDVLNENLDDCKYLNFPSTNL